MEIELTRAVHAQLLEDAALRAPDEACGLLLGREGIEELRPCANVHSAPSSHFEIEPQALIDAYRAARQGGLKVIGYYHSHPQGRAEPSATDRAMASSDGRVWAIVARETVTFWRDGVQGFEPLSYRLRDG